MKTTFDLKRTLDFLSELKANNRKDWFDQHRVNYEDAKANFEAFVNGFISDFRTVEDFGAISARDCMFRINRDIRFSRDKSPYKPYLSAHIARGGRNSGNLGYYLQLAPGGESIIAGGLHTPSPEQLAQLAATPRTVVIRYLPSDPGKFVMITPAPAPDSASVK